MDVVIHTYGRSNRPQQHTLRALEAEGLKPTLAVQARESDLYGWYDGPLLVLPPEITRLAPTRDWLIRAPGSDNVVFLDDDLHFFVRRDDDRTKFRSPEKGDLRLMLSMIETALDNHASHVGIAAREGGNRLTEPFYFNTRIMRVLGYKRPIVAGLKARFADVEVMEDFHMNLSLLESGRMSLMLNDWCSNQAGGSDAPGGCSHYRTPAVQTASAVALEKLHPGFVKVVEKKTKTAWGGGTRTDVIVQWKKAYEHGKLRS